MRRSATDVKVGVFVASAMGILIMALAVLGGIKLLKSPRMYHIRFEESVAGLDKGSPVRLKGVRVGQVEDLRIPEDDITRVQVTISVRKGTPLKADSEATIASVGITGLRYIELTPGTIGAPELLPGSTMIGRESLLSTIQGTAETAILKGEVLLDNLIAITSLENRQLVQNILGDVASAVRENSDNVTATVSEIRGLAASLRASMEELQAVLEQNKDNINSTLVNMNSVMEDAKPLFERLGDEKTVERIDTTIKDVSELMARLNTLVGDNQYGIDQTLMDLRESSRNLNEFTRSIRARPSLLLRGAAVTPRVIAE